MNYDFQSSGYISRAISEYRYIETMEEISDYDYDDILSYYEHDSSLHKITDYYIDGGMVENSHRNMKLSDYKYIEKEAGIIFDISKLIPMNISCCRGSTGYMLTDYTEIPNIDLRCMISPYTGRILPNKVNLLLKVLNKNKDI